MPRMSLTSPNIKAKVRSSQSHNPWLFTLERKDCVHPRSGAWLDRQSCTIHKRISADTKTLWWTIVSVTVVCKNHG